MTTEDDRAYYHMKRDEIVLPERGQLPSANHYYLGHLPTPATGLLPFPNLQGDAGADTVMRRVGEWGWGQASITSFKEVGT